MPSRRRERNGAEILHEDHHAAFELLPLRRQSGAAGNGIINPISNKSWDYLRRFNNDRVFFRPKKIIGTPRVHIASPEDLGVLRAEHILTAH